MVWLKIDEIEMDPQYHPRSKVDRVLVWRYKIAAEAGANFPPILVGKKGKKYVLIDGWHRILAFKVLKKESIEAFIIQKPEKEWFAEAVRINVAHGKRLTTYELIKATLKLKEQGFSREQIAEIVRMPPAKLERLVKRRVIRSELNKPVVLKASLTHLAKEEEVVSAEVIEETQEKLIGTSLFALLDQLISLLEKELIDLKNQAIISRLQKLKQLLNEIPI